LQSLELVRPEVLGFEPATIGIGQTVELIATTPNAPSKLHRLVMASRFYDFEIVQIRCGNHNTLMVPCMASVFENFDLLSVCQTMAPRQKILLTVRNPKCKNPEFHAAALLAVLYKDSSTIIP
jgi:hypothetical protein